MDYHSVLRTGGIHEDILATIEQFDNRKTPTRPADNKRIVWQHQTSFFTIVQSNEICHMTWHKVVQQLNNSMKVLGMISKFPIFMLILEIFDLNPL